MKAYVLVAMASFAILMGSSVSAVAGKADGTKCVNSKSCSSKTCEKAPGAKFGTCCVRETCASLSAQCGEASDGCGAPLSCGDCGEGFHCDTNICEPNIVCGWPVDENGNPTGGYILSCEGCSITDCTLSCSCLDVNAVPQDASLNLNDCNPAANTIQNFNGVLVCDPIPTTTTTSTTTSTTSTTSTTVTSTTLGCPPTCGNFQFCNSSQGCYILPTAENSCGECGFGTCDNPSCTASSDCGPGGTCFTNTCCGAGGICGTVCTPDF